MSHPATDSLISPTLKHLREHWWNDEFTEFLTETLRPRPGNRILDVGCGEGGAEVRIGHLHVSQLRLYGVDLKVHELVKAAAETAAHNQRARFIGGDARRLPFADGIFDSTYCVAVLQHIADVDAAVRELARVTRGDGRIVAVEPDNAGHCAHSSTPTGEDAFEAARRFFAAAAEARNDATAQAVGPRIPSLFVAHGVEPIEVRLFPVSHVILGPPAEDLWAERRAVVERYSANTTGNVRELGLAYQAALDAYERDARAAGTSFVEIQNTMLFATVGQKAA